MHRPKLALFTRHPHCSLQCCNGIMQALGGDYQFKLFNERQCEGNTFDDIDCVVFPGGVGDSDSYHRFFQNRKHRKFVVDYVAQGGRYLGVCMGAYWAGKDYFNILQSGDTVQYISRPHTDTRRPHPKAVAVTWQGQLEHMYFYDGCAMIGSPVAWQTVATYANGDAMAVIQNRVGLIGCHPESEPFWYQHHSWMRDRYHNGRHHELLKNFVNTLMQK